jgi:hypothetical protein
LVPNDFGDDPWLIALRRIADPDVTSYLASFLLTRAFGRRTQNCTDLVVFAFDKVTRPRSVRALPDDAWRLLDDRLYRSYWPNRDRCKRIRQTTGDLFVVSCCRFDGHRDWVFHEAGGGSRRDESLVESSRLNGQK